MNLPRWARGLRPRQGQEGAGSATSSGADALSHRTLPDRSASLAPAEEFTPKLAQQRLAAPTPRASWTPPGVGVTGTQERPF